jgi:hypothetical protein
LALLFFISGVAGRFLLEKLTPGRFAVDRFKRLFVVLLLGMWVINPIQVYVEFLDKGLIERIVAVHGRVHSSGCRR